MRHGYTDRPPALMVNPVLAADKATVHIQMQVRWDLRTKPTPDNVNSNTGMPPDLSRKSPFRIFPHASHYYLY